MEFVVDDSIVSFIPLLFPLVEAVITPFAFFRSFGSTRSFKNLVTLTSSQYIHNVSDQCQPIFT